MITGKLASLLARGSRQLAIGFVFAVFPWNCLAHKLMPGPLPPDILENRGNLEYETEAAGQQGVLAHSRASR